MPVVVHPKCDPGMVTGSQLSMVKWRLKPYVPEPELMSDQAGLKEMLT